MQPAAPEISICPGCGGALEETFGGGRGCMVCLLRVGIGGEDPASAGQDLAPNAFEGNERFGIYEIERRPDGTLYELGRGAMGVTYRATDASLQRKIALKVIKIGIAGRRAEARERFMREARTAAALRHENIATVFQFGICEETGQCFYAMELIEGETLEEHVRRTGPLDVRTTIHIARQVTAALATAEKRGLIHRDLKPANLMLVSPDGETDGTDRDDEKPIVKIIDFGLAKALNAPVDPMLLTRGGFVGTPAFASPEQFEHSALDVRSDIYSLGVTLWFALTGKTPFGGRNVDEIRRAQQLHALPTEQLKVARVPSRLRSLLSSMLALEPAARPGTHDLAARLQRCFAEANRVRSTDFALAAAVILVLSVSAFFVYPLLRDQNLASSPPGAEKSIAVLPFENLSEEKANANFADGVQDDILTKLAKIADLKVISRTSVMQYRSGRNIRRIGHALGVLHVLEGTVRRSGGKVHVNAQLVDARTDTHLWAEQYDRDLKDVFTIQSEIVRKVADHLHAKVLAAEKLAIDRPPTADLIAFDLYARANNLLLMTSLDSGAANLLRSAVGLLDQAVIRDPSFFQAYCKLSYAHDRLYFAFDHTPARLAQAEAAVQAAFRLRPDAGEARLARARNLYLGYLDYNGALTELELASQNLPNDSEVFELKAYIQRRQGKQEEALRNFERAMELDPANVFTLHQIAISYELLQRYAEAKLVLERALAIAPNDLVTKAERALVELDWKADTYPLHELINSIRATNPAAIQSIANHWLICALAERNAAAAQEALIALGETPFRYAAVRFNRPFVEGVIARLTKDDPKAWSAFTAGRAEQEKIIQAQPDFAPPLCALGLIEAALGRKEEALREGQRAVELLPVEKDAILGPLIVEYLAMIAAWVRENDLACEQLAVAIQPPTRVSYGQLKLMPFWDPLRGDPRFEKIVASLAPKETPNVIR